MTPEQTNATEKMTSVKTACEKAPAGPRKDRALRHYLAAEKAHAASNYAETHKELNAAAEAIS